MTEQNLFIPSDDLLRALAGEQPCSVCSMGLGVVVTFPEQWDVVVAHTPGCPGLRSRTHRDADDSRHLEVVRGFRDQEVGADELDGRAVGAHRGTDAEV